MPTSLNVWYASCPVETWDRLRLIISPGRLHFIARVYCLPKSLAQRPPCHILTGRCSAHRVKAPFRGRKLEYEGCPGVPYKTLALMQHCLLCSLHAYSSVLPAPASTLLARLPCAVSSRCRGRAPEGGPFPSPFSSASGASEAAGFTTCRDHTPSPSLIIFLSG